jgi:hypothetical protein
VSVRWVTPLAVIAVLVTACGQHAGHPDSGGRGAASPAVVPFDAFLASVRSATYRGYAGRPGAKVRSERAFDEMRRFLLGRYRHARAVRSYSVAGGVFDCLRWRGSSVPPSAPSPGESPGAAASAAAFGAAGGGCPEGSVPVRRITLAEIVRFPTLEDFLSKSPGGSGGLPTAP